MEVAIWRQVLRRHWPAILIAVGLCVFWTSRITGYPVCCDALETLRMTLSAAHAGTLSLDDEPPFRPTMYREPLPPLINAGLLRLMETFTGAGGFDDYQRGERVPWLKYQNVIWMLALCVAAYLATWWRTRSVTLSIAAAVLGQSIFFYSGMTGVSVDSLFTDIMGASLLVIGSVIYAAGMTKRSWRTLALAGLVFGLLALTKAAFVPVFAGLVIATPAIWWVVRQRVGWKRAALLVIALTTPFLVILAPSYYRNYRQFSVLKLSDRGGVNLYTRAVKNQIWPRQYIGAFYAWAPSPARPLIGALTGYRPEDLEAGGRLQAFNWLGNPAFLERDRIAMFDGKPEEAISYHYQARAELYKRTAAFRAAGHPHPDLAADAALTREALDLISEQPVAHLLVSVPFMWRGALLSFPLLVVVLVLALRSRDVGLLAFSLPAFGMVVFYACISNFEARYGVPMMPIVAVAGSCALAAAVSAARSRRSSKGRDDSDHAPRQLAAL